MRTYTNMTWPDDPYRTGQQLYRRPVPRLAAFTAGPAAAGGPPVPAVVAIVYLPLHRTQAVTVTEETLTFGFRAASADDPADMPALAAIADLDLMQARRHAAVLAGHLLADDLAAVRQAGDAGRCEGWQRSSANGRLAARRRARRRRSTALWTCPAARRWKMPAGRQASPPAWVTHSAVRTGQPAARRRWRWSAH